MKVCNTCHDDKPLDAFHRRKASPDGLSYTCKACAKARALTQHHTHGEQRNATRKQRYLANHMAELATHKAWREANVERARAFVREWTAAHPERKAASDRAWRLANPDKTSWHGSQRRAAIKRATPLWVDFAAIEQVYLEAAAMRELGLDVHVDHDVPLRGRTVSGLHVANNLCVRLAEDNLRKGNTFIQP